MRRLAARLVSLYPRAWRDRYGAELVALLEELDVRPRDLADVVGGALRAHVAGWKGSDSMKTSLRFAIVALVLGVSVVVLALLLTGVLSEGPQEFLLLLAPLLVIPAMGPLAMTYPPGSPRLNAFTRTLGVASGVAASLLAVVSIGVSVFNPGPTAPVPLLGALFFLGLIGLALWFVLNGWQSLRGGQLPGGLALLGILFGLLSLIVFFSSNGAVQAAVPRPSYTGLMNVVTPLWLLGGFVWMAWTAGWSWWTRRPDRTGRAVGSG
jgi:hypothetical protein